MNKKLLVIFSLFITVIFNIPVVLFLLGNHTKTIFYNFDWNTFSAILSSTIGIAINSITLLILIYDNSKSKVDSLCGNLLDILYRQNDQLQNQWNKLYTNNTLDDLFNKLNEEINIYFKSIAIRDHLFKKKLSSFSSEIQDLFTIYSCDSNKHSYSSAQEFDDDEGTIYQTEVIYNIINKLPFKNIKTCDELFSKLNISSKYKKKWIEESCLFAIYNSSIKNELKTFLNTFEYAVNRLENYPEVFSLFCSQLTIQQRYFLTYYYSYSECRKLPKEKIISQFRLLHYSNPILSEKIGKLIDEAEEEAFFRFYETKMNSSKRHKKINN